VIVYLEILSKQ